MSGSFKSSGLLALITVSAFGQATTQQPALEVASIRIYPAASPFRPESQGFTASPDGIRATHVTLRGCLQWAYNIVDVTGPGWITEESYDIMAKAQGPVPAGELRQMLQKLLEDRFSLKIHRESKLSSVGVLVVAKSGVKNLYAREADGSMEIKRTDGKLELKNAPMSGVVGVFGSPFGNMPLEKVVDQTGLSGTYDITLDLKDFDPKDRQYGGNYQEMRDALFRFLSESLEKQYGLRLERRNLPVETLVVDGGNKMPTDN